MSDVSDKIRPVRTALDLSALERQIETIAGVGPLIGRREFDEFGRPASVSGYAISIAIAQAAARIAGPTYRSYRLQIRGRTIIEFRRRVESPRERIERRYRAWVRNTLGLMSRDDALSLYGIRPRPTWRDRALLAYATAFVWLTNAALYRWLLRTVALALWIVVVSALLLLAWSALPTY